MASEPALVINGWVILAHAQFLDSLEVLMAEVGSLRAKDTANYRSKNATKRLAAIAKLAFEVIPQDPTRAEYRLGGALGEEHRHWFRAKFFQQYRLFFRFHRASKTLVYAWVNDETTKLSYDSPTDAYAVFRRRLSKGKPPDDWEPLFTEAKREASRFSKTKGKVS